jgi:oligopeptide/dipeptide ABC transporter ATP-binding protein
MSLLQVKNLVVEFPSRHGTLRALDEISFDIAPGEILGVVGESGAGKSLTGASIIGLLEPPGRIASGQILLEGQRIDNLNNDQMRSIRGRKIGAIFQDPLTSLNPLYSVGKQLTETIQAHLPVSDQEARQRAIALLQDTGISAAAERIDHYPHQFSGGMRQRVVIALALAAEPQLIVADEPTTALDVSIQAQIISLLKNVCKKRGAAVMLITHDMGVIAETCDRVAVMYAGRIAEIGPVHQVINHPEHPYTAGLMASIPDMDVDRERLNQIDGAMPRLNAIPKGCAFNPRCPQVFDRCLQERPDLAAVSRSGQNTPHFGGRVMSVPDSPPNSQALVIARDLAKTFDVSAPWLSRVIERKPRQLLKAVDGVSFEIERGKTLALVGESGCGKSTVARLLVGLYEPTRGGLTFDGQDAHAAFKSSDAKAMRKRIQMIFQDPYASLNPRWTVEAIVGEPLHEHGLIKDEQELKDRVAELLKSVGLSALDMVKYPHQFSGGQRQRISIARALATAPEFLVCDEPTSALDVSVQAQVLNIMKDLQRERGLTYLFISHNLAVVRHVSDKVGVMYLGQLVELADKHTLFDNPQHPYTRMLLDAIPKMKDTGRARTPVQGEVPNPLNPPPGCSFNPRCPLANERCRIERPVLKNINGIKIACHAVEEGRH